MTLLAVTGMSKSFGGVHALSGIEFGVDAGRLVGLIGPNGAGKTTLVNCITGVIQPDGGDVRFRDVSIRRWPTHRRADAGIIRTFQAVRLFNELDAIGNVLLGAYRRRPYGVATALVGDRRRGKRALEEKARRLLGDVGLGETQWRRPVSQLGHGERRLVELARAVAGDPLVLCLDEPTAGLNEAESDRFAGWLRSQVSDGLAVLLISHDMPLVMRNCDEVVVVSSGQRVAVGSPDAIRQDPAVIEAYLGDDAGLLAEELAEEVVT